MVASSRATTWDVMGTDLLGMASRGESMSTDRLGVFLGILVGMASRGGSVTESM